MTNNPMSRLNIIKQSEKDHYETLSEFDLRLLMQEYVETKRYLHASYLSRLIIRKRVNAKGELIKAKGGIEV